MTEAKLIQVNGKNNGYEISQIYILDEFDNIKYICGVSDNYPEDKYLSRDLSFMKNLANKMYEIFQNYNINEVVNVYINYDEYVSIDDLLKENIDKLKSNNLINL